MYNGRTVHSRFKAHFGPITSIDWHIQDNIVASSSLIGDIVLHNIQNGMQIANFNQKSSNGVKMIKFSPFIKEYLAAASNDGTVSIWDINKRNYVVSYNLAHASRVNALAFSPMNQKLMCSVSLDQNINFYDINQKKWKNKYFYIFNCFINRPVKSVYSENSLTALAWNNDGTTIAVGGMNGRIF